MCRPCNCSRVLRTSEGTYHGEAARSAKKPDGLVSIESGTCARRRYLTRSKICDRGSDAEINHGTLGIFVGSEESHSTGEGSKESRRNTSIKSSYQTFLAPDSAVGRAHGCVFWRHVRVALLSRLDCVQRMHEHVTHQATETSCKHCLDSVNLGPVAVSSCRPT